MPAIKFAEFVNQAPKIQPKGEIYQLGSLKPHWIIAVNTHGIELDTPNIAVRDQDIAHSFRDNKDNQLPRDWYKNLPQHLKNPDAVILDKTHPDGPSLLLIYKGKDKAYKLVVRLNYNVRKQGVMNIVGSGQKVIIGGIKAMLGKGYILIEGSL
ncbi:MAG: hypothetical protein ORN98_10930 [Alphaproteobacteria bacterium]|nr:hypothetical protein [Alphaproteobacteria bacterium]